MTDHVRKIVDSIKRLLKMRNEKNKPMSDHILITAQSLFDLVDELERTEREKDAAVGDIERLAKPPYEVVFCDICKYGSDEEECQKRNCNGDRRDFEWRGAQEVE